MGRIAESLSAARVLVYDVETRPMCSFHWGARDQNFTPTQVLDGGGVLCWAARWLDKRQVMFASDHHDGHDVMVERLHELICEAQVVIGYNQVSFDDKRMAVEYQRAGLPVPTPVRSIDLLKAVRARFGYPINKLAHVADELGLGSKLAHTGWDLWRRCITDADGAPYLGPVPQGGGDGQAWNVMRRYCKQDVRLTTDVYWELVKGGWIKNHPHLGLFTGDLDGCGTCGGTLEAAGTTTTATAVYGLWRCTDCGALARDARRAGNTTGTRAV